MEQLKRTKRYLERIRNIYSGVFSSSGHDKQAYDDDVISFFIHCYHVRDWIIHLNSVGITASEVDSFINSHLPLRICADLANGSKHCRLTRSLRTEWQPNISGKEYRTIYWYARDGGGEHLRAKYQVSSNMEHHDALSLAEACVDLWDGFVNTIRANINAN